MKAKKFNIIDAMLEANKEIFFSVENPTSHESTIFINNVSNELILTLTNNTPEMLHLKKGEPVPYDKIKEKDFTNIYLTFPELTPMALKDITLLTAEWQMTCLTSSDPDAPASYLALSPKGPLDVVKGGTLSLKLGNIKSTLERAAPGSMVIDYHHLIKGTKDVSKDQEVALAYVIPPKPALKNDPFLYFWLTGDGVDPYISLDNNISPISVVITGKSDVPIANKIKFVIANARQEPLVIDPKEEQSPILFVTFISGTIAAGEEQGGYGALATKEEIQAIAMKEGTFYGNSWKISFQKTSNLIYWELLPQGPQILGARDKASVEFNLENIITTLSPGVTFMYIQYTNIPGYNDGVLIFPIRKVESKPTIRDFRIDKEECNYGEEVTVYWETYGGACQLVIDNQDPMPVEFRGEKKITVLKPTRIELFCGNGAHVAKETRLIKKVNPIDIDLKVTPSALTMYDYFNRDIEIAWKVKNATNCRLVINNGGIQEISKEGNYRFKPTQKTTTCTVSGYNSNVAYKIQQTQAVDTHCDIAKIFYAKGEALYQWTFEEGAKQIVAGEKDQKILALKFFGTKGTLFPQGIRTCMGVVRQNSEKLDLYPYKDRVLLLPNIVTMPLPPGTVAFSYMDLTYEERVSFMVPGQGGVKVYYSFLGDDYKSLVEDSINFASKKIFPKIHSLLYDNQSWGLNYGCLICADGFLKFYKKGGIAEPRAQNVVDFLCTLTIEGDVPANEQVLYWIDGNEQKLIKANLKGENKQTLCEVHVGNTAPCLTFDNANRHLYWVEKMDGKERLCRFNSNTNRREGLMELDGLSEGGGLVVISQ